MIELLPTDFDGLLLIGHGTRDPAGLAEFWQLVELLRREQPDWQIEGCLLELAQPTIAEGLGNLIRRGARRVRVVPLVLFAAGHAKRDIPAALATAADEHPGVVIDQAPHLGCHEAIVELSERRFHEAIRDHQKVAVGQTLLLLVGRGSHDREATGQMRQFAACRAAREAPGHIETAFIAMAEPRLEDALQAASRSKYARCVVQPHLLFAGLLLTDLRAAVGRVAASAPEKEWILADPLGPDIRLAAAVAEIAGGKLSVPA